MTALHCIMRPQSIGYRYFSSFFAFPSCNPFHSIILLTPLCLLLIFHLDKIHRIKEDDSLKVIRCVLPNIPKEQFCHSCCQFFCCVQKSEKKRKKYCAKIVNNHCCVWTHANTHVISCCVCIQKVMLLWIHAMQYVKTTHTHTHAL